MNRISHQEAGDASQSSEQGDLDRLKELAAVGCTDAEIADILGYSSKTLDRRFGRIIRQARATGVVSLRKEQWKKATDGNVPMLIWLGRQRLGQSPETACSCGRRAACADRPGHEPESVMESEKCKLQSAK